LSVCIPDFKGPPPVLLKHRHQTANWM